MGTLKLEGKIPETQDKINNYTSGKNINDLTIEELVERIRNKVQRIYKKNQNNRSIFN